MNKKKRILHLAHEMGVGGTQQVIRQLISHLDPEEFECSVACIDGYVGMLGEQLQADGVPIHVFDRKPGFDRALIRDIKALLVEQSFDLIHCHQYTPYTYGVLAAMFLDVKVVFTEHGRFYPDTYSWKRRLLNPLLQRRTNAIVAISAATADALKKYEWFSRGAVEVIYNGTDIGGATDCREAVRVELGLGSKTLVFGTIARFDSIKNLSMMIAGFQALQEKWDGDSALLMVGDGDERDMLEKLVCDSGLDNRVFFTGYKSDTHRYMSMIDVYLLTSYSEGTSMTLLEAMAHCKPSIVTAVGGNVEIIEHMKQGIVVQSGDVDGLVAGMLRVSEDAAMRRQLGLAARDAFEQRFSVRSMIGQYQRLYRRTL